MNSLHGVNANTNNDVSYFLRCLAEGSGDVAFVKHTTVSDNVNGTEDWNSSLNKGDYQLLCANGTRADIDNYNSCHLAKVPSHALMTAGDQTENKINEMVNLFLDAKVRFRTSSVFSLIFGTNIFKNTNLLTFPRVAMVTLFSTQTRM